MNPPSSSRSKHRRRTPRKLPQVPTDSTSSRLCEPQKIEPSVAGSERETCYHDNYKKQSRVSDTVRKLAAAKQRNVSSVDSASMRRYSLIEYKPSLTESYDDLSQMVGPMTDDAIRKILQNRFTAGDYFTNVGPVLVSLNPQSVVPVNSSHLKEIPSCHPFLKTTVQRALDQLRESGHSQVIVLSGECGSGKTTNAEIILRQIFEMAGGGSETDTFKHMSASITVLRSLGNASVNGNIESSRMGNYTEVYISDGVVHRTKSQCYFIDQNRIIQSQDSSSNYQIFHQLLAGLSAEEKVKFHLQSYSVENLSYLKQDRWSRDQDQDAAQFSAWKDALSTLGIPFSDVMRIFGAVLLLGNINFTESDTSDIEVVGNNEIKSVAALLGVSGVSLYRGFTCRTQSTKSQMLRTSANAAWANKCRGSLARALYCRTVNAIAKRANSLKKTPSHKSEGSTDSNGDNYISRDYSTRKDSVGRLIPKEALIGIVDMFGFENSEANRLEQLCINLCAETMQHFYNAHIFKSIMESYREDDVQCDIEVEYGDNSAVIELISAQYTGILSLLDSESLQVGCSPDLYLERVCTQHADNPSFLLSGGASSFTIIHYADRVEYDSSSFIDSNRDEIYDDVVNIFSKKTCNFGFVSHLFGPELKALLDGGGSPQGIHYRIFPSFGQSTSIGARDSISTLSQDFHSRLDILLKTLVQSKPHFIRCIRPNSTGQPEVFDRATVVRQVHALQLANTVQLMAGGFPHRMRYKSFNARYNFLSIGLLRPGDRAQEECMTILEQFLRLMDENSLPYSSATWALGRKYIFLSENARQQFEHLRGEWRYMAATRIQTCWRRFVAVCQWPTLKSQLKAKQIRRKQLQQRKPSRSSLSELVTPKHVYPKPVMGVSKFVQRSPGSNSPSRQAVTNSPARTPEKIPPNRVSQPPLVPQATVLAQTPISQSVLPQSKLDQELNIKKTDNQTHKNLTGITAKQNWPNTDQQSNGHKTRPPPPPVAKKPITVPKKPAMEVKPLMSPTKIVESFTFNEQLSPGFNKKTSPDNTSQYIKSPGNQPYGKSNSNHVHVSANQVYGDFPRQQPPTKSQLYVKPIENQPHQKSSGSLPSEYQPHQKSSGSLSSEYQPHQKSSGSLPSEYQPHQKSSGSLPSEYQPHQKSSGSLPSEYQPHQKSSGSLPSEYQPHQKSSGSLPSEYQHHQKSSGGQHSEFQHHQKSSRSVPSEYQHHQKSSGSPPSEYQHHQKSFGSPPSEIKHHPKSLANRPAPVRKHAMPPGNVPPPLPGRRPYTVAGNYKVGYPQTRIMKEIFSDGSGHILVKGEEVQVIGTSSTRGYLVVERNDSSISVPYQIMELKAKLNAGMNI